MSKLTLQRERLHNREATRAAESFPEAKASSKGYQQISSARLLQMESNDALA
jgi:hypothetical protein